MGYLQDGDHRTAIHNDEENVRWITFLLHSEIVCDQIHIPSIVTSRNSELGV
jgi:hypothetical protein